MIKCSLQCLISQRSASDLNSLLAESCCCPLEESSAHVTCCSSSISSTCYLDFRKICGIILITSYQTWGKIVSSASDFISSLTKSCCCPPEESNGHITSWSASVSSSFSCLTRFGQHVFFFVLSWWTDGSRMLQGLTNLLGCFHNWSLNN